LSSKYFEDELVVAPAIVDFAVATVVVVVVVAVGIVAAVIAVVVVDFALFL